MRVLIVCSAGGHLSQAYALKPWWQQHERKWITFDSENAKSLLAGEDIEFGFSPTTRNIPNLLRNSKMARRVMKEYRPDLVFSTGAGIAVPYFYLARKSGAHTAYLEVIDRIDSATLTGRLVYPVTDRFLVQWRDQLQFYPDAELVGPVI